MPPTANSYWIASAWYGKLAIHGAGELFALCLHHGSTPSRPAGGSVQTDRSSSTASDDVPLAS